MWAEAHWSSVRHWWIPAGFKAHHVSRCHRLTEKTADLKDTDKRKCMTCLARLARWEPNGEWRGMQTMSDILKLSPRDLAQRLWTEAQPGEYIGQTLCRLIDREDPGNPAGSASGYVIVADIAARDAALMGIVSALNWHSGYYIFLPASSHNPGIAVACRKWRKVAQGWAEGRTPR